ncbi:MAG: immune inhibitor A [Bacteroidetes bacterium]|nr:immune inhibitor A [Bacteroidota bacterium]
MKKTIYLLILAVACNLAKAQTNIFHENMENIDSVFASGNPGWFANTRLQTSGTQSDSTSITISDTSFLETQSFDLTGYTYVLFNFNHICKLSFFDKGVVEVFNGSVWIQLTSQHMVAGQTDSVAFAGLANVFSEAVNPAWLPGQIVSPDNSWWQNVAFDVSALLANVSNAKIRWSAIDFGTPGGDFRAGWFIDDVNVIAAPCELQPPSLTQLTPILQNTVLSTGPYTLNINLADVSGIDTNNVFLIYTLNNGLPDSVLMINTSGNIFSGIIPAVSDSDSVCYYFSARDFSTCFNSIAYPSSGCINFLALSGLTIPFCDSFDFNNFWTPTILTGSPWQIGSPNTSPPSAYSAPNVWEVALNSQYVGNTQSYLTSPPLSFINITNANLNFWFYSDCENTWDGTRMEYSIDNGTSWVTLGGLGTGVNWYNDASLNSSLLPGWTGNGLSTGGGSLWLNAQHNLSVLNNQPNVLLRFVFTSDGSVQDNGFAIDDFCISVPTYDDAGVTTVSSTQQNLPAAGTADSINVTLKNYGGNPIQNIPVYFAINNGAAFGPYIYTDTIQPLQSSPLFTIPGLTYTVPSGAYSICAWTDYLQDSFSANDTSCTLTSSVITIAITDTNTYCDNFENGNNGWQSKIEALGNSSTKWELGLPSVGQTNSTHSGINAWDINLDSVYSNNANTVLISPYFSVSANANPNLSFWANYNVENFWDGVRLEFSADGIVWNTIGTVGDTSGTNWYNTQTVTCSNLPGWSNSSAGWRAIQYKNMYFLNGQNIQLRFSFCSDGVVTRDGFSIDDFCFGNDTSFTTSFNEISQQQHNGVFIQANPNPFSQSTTLEFFIPQSGICSFGISDLSGRIVRNTFHKKFSAGKNQIHLKSERLQAGVYFLTLYYKNRNYKTKIVISD